MFHLKPYQEKAVGKLTEGALELLHESQGSNLRRVPLLLRAPTGSGKTVTMAAFLEQFTAAAEREDMLKHKRYAFIWIAPMKLHLQSYERLKAFYAETRSLRPVLFNDVAGKTIAPDEILFLNWESINSDDNILWRENEQGRTIPNLVQRTRAAGREIIVIIDEYHLFAHKGERSEIVLKTLDARLEIAVTATPPANFAAKTANRGRIVKISRHDVVQAEMIKRGVRLNPDLDPSLQDGRTLNSVLLDTAMKRCSALAEAYRAL
jgi:type III restriction enzyme